MTSTVGSLVAENSLEESSSSQQTNANIKNLGLAEELQTARTDAEEALKALLQFSEGVRMITRHMQSAAVDDTSDSEAEEEETKVEPESNPTLKIEQMVSETCLQGTVFGTDLLRLWDAAHHVRDFARLVTEESAVSTNDIVMAQRTAKRAVKRARKAETLALNLHRQNQELRQQLDQLSYQKKFLVQEVKALRQQAAASRKLDMERLVQQHVAGAILLHEEQLKSMAAAAQQQKKLKKKVRAEAEEEKKEDDDMEVVKAEDCHRPGLESSDQNKPQMEKKTVEVASTMGKENQVQGGNNAPVATKTITADAPSKEKSVANKQQPLPPTPPTDYQPIKLLPKPGRLSPTLPLPPSPPPSKPSSSRSMDSEQSSVVVLPPEQPKENVGSKVFNFLFHPEKIGQQRMIEMERQRQLEKLREKEENEKPAQIAQATKRNPLLALDDEKEVASVDATAPTQAATTPSSTCASSSLRARSMFGDRLVSTGSEDQYTPKHAFEGRNNATTPTVIPNCVAFSEDTLSVQSNLPSPRIQNSKLPSLDVSLEEDENDANPDVEVYKEFKMFQSLAIPAEDEIDEYHQTRDQEVKQ